MKYPLKYLIFYFFLFTTPIVVYSQAYTLNINNQKQLPFKTIQYTKKHKQKKEALIEINKLILFFQSKGFLLAEIDTVAQSNTQLDINIIANQQFKWVKLKLGNLNPTLASKTGFSEKLFLNKPFYYKHLTQLKEKIITHYENNGYPFASIKLDSIAVEEAKFTAVLNVDKGLYYKIDSVIIMGNAKLNPKFLHRYLSVVPAKPYNEQALKSISSKIIQLPFVNQKKAHEVKLTDKTNKLLLFLDKKNASQFDGIIGVQPDANTGKTVLTGDVKIKVVNGILSNGETFDLEWRRLRELTQDFKGKLIYPYMFGSAFGSDYGLKIYKRDTTFIDINNEISLHYYYSGLNYINIHFKQRSSNLISTYGLANITTLPSFADVSTQMNGFGILYEKLDYRFNPKKGISVQLNASAGSKKIRKNPKINDLAYNNLLLNSTQYVYDAVINTYAHLGNNNVLKIGVQSASIFGNAPLFRNEFIRIGGLKTLRGFDEESIFTSFYVIPTIEYRFLFSQNSNIVVFTEGAFYEANGFNTYINDTPISIGTGINFETKAGILSINYAIGNQFGNGFDARNGKIHFGLTALF